MSLKVGLMRANMADVPEPKQLFGGLEKYQMSPSNLFSAHLRHQGDQRLLHRASFDFQPGVEVAVAARR